jgi:tetratricopeptide (TPR) repeat protein
MKQSSFVYFASSLALLLLAGCMQASAPAKSGVHPDAVSAVAAIRAAGQQFDSSVEVHPLRDPAVDGLLQKAHEQEAQQQPTQALDSVRKALTIAPNAPDLLQLQAELAIETGDWKQATALAQKSYDLGPKVGGLCARNLETLARTRAATGDDAGAATARQQLASCKVPAPNRF